MIRRVRSGGMETHLSLALLVCASLLIYAFVLSLAPGDDGRGEGLFELRLLQASCLSSSILNYDDGSGSGPLVEKLGMGERPLIVIWTGSTLSVMEGGSMEDLSGLLSVLERSPDGLGCLILVGHVGYDVGKVVGRVAFHRTNLEGGTEMAVGMPLVRGGASFRGVSF